MLNGIDPIMIFQIYKKVITEVASVSLTGEPLKQTTEQKVTSAVIPLYLSEELTGLFIDSESKNIDIETNVDSLTNGTAGDVTQRTIGSILTVNLKARSDSLGLTTLIALADLILNKTASKEYEITYIHGATTIFGGLLHGFSVDQGGSDDLLKIKLELSKGRPKPTSVEVGNDPNAVRAGSTGATPQPGASTASAPVPKATSHTSVISPSLRMP